MNPASRFIGIANLTQAFDYQIWIYLSSEIFGFAMDPYFGRRKVWIDQNTAIESIIISDNCVVDILELTRRRSHS
jgi:hypothetical protein